MNTLHNEYFQGGQSLNVTRIAERPDGQRIRVRIKRDSHDSQSHAIADVWTANGWTEVVRRHDITALKIGAFSYTSRDAAGWQKAIDADAKALLDLAAFLLP